MKHVVLIEHPDHWEVIADYSGSPRHASMSEDEWFREFQGDSYQRMRESHPDAQAAFAPHGRGCWSKDWQKPWTSGVPSLYATSDGEIDFDGIRYAGADGKSRHEIRIETVDAAGDRITGRTASLRALISAPVPLSDYEPVLIDGVATLSVGPCGNPCDLTIRIADPARRVKGTALRLRFR